MAGPRGSVPDAAVPRWPIAVSPMANRGRDSDLRSRVGRVLRRVRAILREPVRRRGRRRRPIHHLQALRSIRITRHGAAVGEQSRRPFLAHTPVAPGARGRTSAAHVVLVCCRPRGCRPVRGNTRRHRLPFHDGLALQHHTRAITLALVLHGRILRIPHRPARAAALHLHRHLEAWAIRHRPPHKPHPGLRCSYGLHRRDLRAHGGRHRHRLRGAGQPRDLAAGGGAGSRTVSAAQEQAPARREPPDVRRAGRSLRGHFASGTTPGGRDRARGGLAHGHRDHRPGAEVALRGHTPEGGRGLPERGGLRVAYGRIAKPCRSCTRGKRSAVW